MNGKPTSNLTEGAWRHGLADREWVRLRPLLPSRARTGRPPKDRRMIIGALLWLSRTGAPWRDLPGALRAVADGGNAVLPLDPLGAMGTPPGRAAEERGRRGRERGRLRQALGRSRGGFGSTLHLRCDRQGRPMALALTPGERNEKAVLPDLMRQGAVKRPGPGQPKVRPRVVVGDRGYSGRPSRDSLRRRGISSVIPQLRTEKRPRLMDWDRYRERNVVERLVGRLKKYRRIATRYDKLAASYLAFVHLAAIRIWL